MMIIIVMKTRAFGLCCRHGCTVNSCRLVQPEGVHYIYNKTINSWLCVAYISSAYVIIIIIMTCNKYTCLSWCIFHLLHHCLRLPKHVRTSQSYTGHQQHRCCEVSSEQHTYLVVSTNYQGILSIILRYSRHFCLLLSLFGSRMKPRPLTC